MKPTQAQCEMKVQVIRSQGRATRLFVNIPLPLAAALDLQAGERVRWQLLNRADLGLIRMTPPTTGGGSFGVSFAYGIASTAKATSNVSLTYSYYWQLLPQRNQAVSFR